MGTAGRRPQTKAGPPATCTAAPRRQPEHQPRARRGRRALAVRARHACGPPGSGVKTRPRPAGARAARVRTGAWTVPPGRGQHSMEGPGGATPAGRGAAGAKWERRRRAVGRAGRTGRRAASPRAAPPPAGRGHRGRPPGVTAERSAGRGAGRPRGVRRCPRPDAPRAPHTPSAAAAHPAPSSGPHPPVAGRQLPLPHSESLPSSPARRLRRPERSALRRRT